MSNEWTMHPSGIPYINCGDNGPSFGPITWAAGCDERCMMEIARKMGAAQELLEACKLALDMVETDHGPPDWDLLRAAIAKAEGR